MTQPWWHQFFDETYAAIGLEVDSDKADAKRARTVDLIMAKLGLSAGDTIFDQCCGIGRLSLPLAQRGLRVIGVDQAARYVEIAQTRASEAGLDCTFHAGDAFAFTAPRPCDGAINWFTSFGYDRDDRVNAQMIERAFASLRPGGRFALDYIAVPRVLAEYQRCILNRLPQADGTELWLIQEPSIDFPTGMMRGTWTFLRDDGSRETRAIENRAFMPHELVRMFAAAGFVDIELGDADGTEFTRTSQRCITIGRKP